MKKIKVGHPGRNLGKYLVKAKPKLATGGTIGKGTTTVKKKGNTSPGSLMKRGPEYRPIKGQAKAKQTRPKHTHAKATSVPKHTHSGY